MASPVESQNSLEYDKNFEHVVGTNIHVTRPTNHFSTVEKCREVRDTDR